MLLYIVIICALLYFPFAKTEYDSSDKIEDQSNTLAKEGNELVDFAYIYDNGDSSDVDENEDLSEKLNKVDNDEQLSVASNYHNNTKYLHEASSENDEKEINIEPKKISDTQPSTNNKVDNEKASCNMQTLGRIRKWDLTSPKSKPGLKLSSDDIKKFKIWPKGIIPYFIDDYSYGKVLRGRIRDSLEKMNSLTGLRFIEVETAPKDGRWVFFVNRRAQLYCSDYNHKSFTDTGVQKVVIGYDCLKDSGKIAVLVLALAGIPPQHNSPDRDKFIKVAIETIIPDKTKLFKKVEADEWVFNDIPYDFFSAGHYPWHKYSANGSATITPMKCVDGPVGEVNTLSCSDLEKIRMLYKTVVSERQQKVNVRQCNTLFKLSKNKLMDTIVNEMPTPTLYEEAISTHRQKVLKLSLGLNQNSKKEESKRVIKLMKSNTRTTMDLFQLSDFHSDDKK